MAMVVDAFAAKLLERLNTVVDDEISLLLGVEDKLERLQRRLERIRGYLEYVEPRRYIDSHIGSVVRDIKDILYDADDVIDLCVIEGQKMHELRPAAMVVCSPVASLFSCFQCVNLFSCFQFVKDRHEIALKVKGLNDRLDEIAKDTPTMTRLGDSTCQGHSNNIANYSRQTSSIETSMNVVGTQIEIASQYLTSLILDDPKQNLAQDKYAKHERFLFGIAGMGGIGKTTLARKIFNNEMIVENYAKRIWVHVGKHSTEIELLKVLIRSLGGDVEGAETRAELEPKLVSCLPADKLFLVLDDIWTAEIWDNLLRAPLKKVVATSKVLFTTRHETIARSLARIVHHVDKMDKDSCWELLYNEVFVYMGEEDISSLKEIATKIVEKCDGLPLAIKAIAGVLRSKERSQIEWKKVLDSGLWSMSQIRIEEGVPSALYLSYEDLPSHLKQCFLYCILYPPNRSIYNKDIVQFWVAEGFIRAQEERLLEEIAEDYFKELIWRNLLQPDPYAKTMHWCTMHDLLRSLAEFLIKDEAICIKGDQRLESNFSSKLRRLSMHTSVVGEKLVLPDKVIEQGCLRALFVFNIKLINFIEDSLLDKLGHLRVLELNDASITSLPNSIGTLLHLRCLHLDRTKIKEIPESIGQLRNLQVLGLSSCKFLHRLPKTVMLLSDLRCLGILHTPLSHVPKGISRLNDLNHLNGFFAGHADNNFEQDEEGGDLEELQSLPKLRLLGLYWLKRAKGGAASALVNKPFLRELILCWGPFQKDEVTIFSEEETIRAEKMCNEMSLPSSLQDLHFVEFPGRELPKWLMASSLGSSFPNLVYLTLQYIPLCKELPPRLNQLPQLKYLSIKKMDAITTIGPEFLSCSSSAGAAFPKLEYLRFNQMCNWEEWSSLSDAVEAIVGGRKNVKLLPNIKQLFVFDCPKLRALPPDLTQIPDLKNMYVEGAHELREIVNLSLTDELNLGQNQMLEKLSNSPSLKRLRVVDCLKLKYVEKLDALQHLTLELPAQELDQLPPWLPMLVEHHQSFRKFELKCSSELFKSCMRGGAHWQIVEQIPEVRIHTFDGNSYLRYTKNPPTYEMNEEFG